MDHNAKTQTRPALIVGALLAPFMCVQEGNVSTLSPSPSMLDSHVSFCFSPILKPLKAEISRLKQGPLFTFQPEQPLPSEVCVAMAEFSNNGNTPATSISIGDCLLLPQIEPPPRLVSLASSLVGFTKRERTLLWFLLIRILLE